jgi:hypothetical protein
MLAQQSLKRTPFLAGCFGGSADVALVLGEQSGEIMTLEVLDRFVLRFAQRARRRRFAVSAGGQIDVVAGVRRTENVKQMMSLSLTSSPAKSIIIFG